eukprot:136175-Rhodomonas_salina.1
MHQEETEIETKRRKWSTYPGRATRVPGTLVPEFIADPSFVLCNPVQRQWGEVYDRHLGRGAGSGTDFTTVTDIYR